MPTRVIIYSGKGGTGKTTVSAATASLVASQGKRVLIMSSDPAHSLSDVMGQVISRDDLTPLAPNLFGLEIDTIYEMRKNMGGFQRFISNTYEGRGIDSRAPGAGLDSCAPRALSRVRLAGVTGRGGRAPFRGGQKTTARGGSVPAARRPSSIPGVSPPATSLPCASSGR